METLSFLCDVSPYGSGAHLIITRPFFVFLFEQLVLRCYSLAPKAVTDALSITAASNASPSSSSSWSATTFVR